MKFIEKDLFWLNEPQNASIKEDSIEIITEPHTDLWQQTYYGFCNDNAPALLKKTKEKEFSFSVQTAFESKQRFDQCGVIIYQSSSSWFKASIEFETGDYQRLGSVVTNNQYSDWATTDIDAKIRTMHYRLSRRGNDFCIENSFDGITFKQMRIFHLLDATDEISFGIYACSPEDSTFKATFTQLNIGECMWLPHK